MIVFPETTFVATFEVNPAFVPTITSASPLVASCAEYVISTESAFVTASFTFNAAALTSGIIESMFNEILSKLDLFFALSSALNTTF